MALRQGPRPRAGEQCPSRKTRFRDEKHAESQLAKIIANPQTQEIPCRSYECDRCGGFHLTSIPLDEFLAHYER